MMPVAGRNGDLATATMIGTTGIQPMLLVMQLELGWTLLPVKDISLINLSRHMLTLPIKWPCQAHEDALLSQDATKF